eukprot:jgi/Bigna1/84359/fgenesh1_pg.131_\
MEVSGDGAHANDAKCNASLSAPLPDISVRNQWLKLCEASRSRWLLKEEIVWALEHGNGGHIKIQDRPLHQPIPGSLFLFDRTQTRFWRKDGYEWRQKNDSHMRLKFNKMGRHASMKCCYNVHKALPTFHRRGYWLLAHPDIILVHYMNNSKKRIGSSPSSTNTAAMKVFREEEGGVPKSAQQQQQQQENEAMEVSPFPTRSAMKGMAPSSVRRVGRKSMKDRKVSMNHVPRKRRIIDYSPNWSFLPGGGKVSPAISTSPETYIRYDATTSTTIPSSSFINPKNRFSTSSSSGSANLPLPHHHRATTRYLDRRGNTGEGGWGSDSPLFLRNTRSISVDVYLTDGRIETEKVEYRFVPLSSSSSTVSSPPTTPRSSTFPLPSPLSPQEDDYLRGGSDGPVLGDERIAENNSGLQRVRSMEEDNKATISSSSDERKGGGALTTNKPAAAAWRMEIGSEIGEGGKPTESTSREGYNGNADDDANGSGYAGSRNPGRGMVNHQDDGDDAADDDNDDDDDDAETVKLGLAFSSITLRDMGINTSDIDGPEPVTDEIFTSAAERIQRQFRSWLYRRHEAANKLQKVMRGMLVRKSLKRSHDAAVIIQKKFRTRRIRREYQKLKSAAIMVQNNYRAKKRNRTTEEKKGSLTMLGRLPTRHHYNAVKAEGGDKMMEISNYDVSAGSVGDRASSTALPPHHDVLSISSPSSFKEEDIIIPQHHAPSISSPLFKDVEIPDIFSHSPSR